MSARSSMKKPPALMRSTTINPTSRGTGSGGAVGSSRNSINNDLDLPTESKLLRAAGAGDIAKLRFLLGRGATLNDQDAHGNTALFHAVWYNREHVVDYILKQLLPKAVDTQNNDGCTCLHFAVARGRSHLSIISKLVEFGASIHVSNVAKASPRDLVRIHPDFTNNRRVKVLFELAGVKHAGRVFASGLQQQQQQRKKSSLASRRPSTRPKGGTGKAAAADPEMTSALEEVFRIATLASNPANLSVQRRYVKPEHMAPVFEFMGLRLTRQMMTEVLKYIDVDNDGRVGMNDFVEVMLEDGLGDAKYEHDMPFRALVGPDASSVNEEDYRRAQEKLGPVFCAENTFEVSNVFRHLRTRAGPDGIVDERLVRDVFSGKFPTSDVVFDVERERFDHEDDDGPQDANEQGAPPGIDRLASAPPPQHHHQPKVRFQV